MTGFDRVLAGVLITARAGKGGGVLLLPFLAVIYLAVFLAKGLNTLVKKAVQ